MKGYQCKICGGLCDPGELVGGVCADCRKEAAGCGGKRKDSVRKDLKETHKRAGMM